MGLLALLDFGSTAAATSLWFWCLQHADAGKLAGYLFLIPLLGMLIAFLWHRKLPDAYQAGGIILILGSVVSLTRQLKNTAPTRHGNDSK